MTLEDILRKAIQKHRDEFRKELIRQAEESDDHQHGTINPRARTAAIARRDQCLHAYDAVGRGRVNEITANLGRLVIAHNIACKLLDIPPHVRTATLVDWEERNAA